MLKLAICILVFVICSLIGFEYGETFNRRRTEIKEVLKDLVVLQNDIIYGTTPLPEAFDSLKEKSSGSVKRFIDSMAEKLKKGEKESVYICASESYKENKEIFNLNKQDLKIMGDFFKTLGESGIYGQDKIFSLTIEQLKINLKDAEEAACKNTKLYRYLGMCIGAMVTIFII